MNKKITIRLSHCNHCAEDIELISEEMLFSATCYFTVKCGCVSSGKMQDGISAAKKWIRDMEKEEDDKS
jgi:hypothetical protein